jgi:hypothetical protein
MQGKLPEVFDLLSISTSPATGIAASSIMPRTGASEGKT